MPPEVTLKHCDAFTTLYLFYPEWGNTAVIHWGSHSFLPLA